MIVESSIAIILLGLLGLFAIAQLTQFWGWETFDWENAATGFSLGLAIAIVCSLIGGIVFGSLFGSCFWISLSLALLISCTKRI